MSDKQKYVIIVAGGSGKRMGTEIPKQFIEIAGLPILMHTITCFYQYDHRIKIILVLPSDQHNYWNELIKQHHFSIAHKVVNGGNERFHSVKNGLAETTKQGLIAVHDGVRPLVSQQTIAACYASALQNKTAVPVIAASESIRKVEGTHNKALNRALYFMVQTPQVFDAELLHNAYEQNFSNVFTDDASVVEAMNNKITLVDGNPENIKITRPMDLKIAEVLLS